MTTITYDVPSVHCGHCQMTIEREVGELAGVVFCFRRHRWKANNH